MTANSRDLTRNSPFPFLSCAESPNSFFSNSSNADKPESFLDFEVEVEDEASLVNLHNRM